MDKEELVGIYTGSVWFKGIMNRMDNAIENTTFLATTNLEGYYG